MAASCTGSAASAAVMEYVQRMWFINKLYLDLELWALPQKQLLPIAVPPEHPRLEAQ
jgi:hypothetical protein